MFCSFFYSFSPSVSWGHLTVLNKPGQPHLGPSSNHFKREQRPFLVQLGTVSLCLSCQGYFCLQLSLARACYGDLFSGTRCLEWLPCPNWALSYHHGPTWTSLTWLMNWLLILPSWFDLGSALSACFCLMVWTLICCLCLAYLRLWSRLWGHLNSWLAISWRKDLLLLLSLLLSSSVCVSAQRWGTVLSQWQKVVAPTHSTEVL